MFPSPGAYCSEVLQGRACHVSVSDVLATAFLLWFTWFTRSNLLPTARPAQLLGHIRDSHKSQTIKRSRAPSPASLYLPRPCPHPPTLSTRPQCLPFPSLPTKGQISRAPVSTSSHHDAPTVVTVMESTRKIAFSVEPLYHYPCYLLNATRAIATSSLYNHYLRHSYRGNAKPCILLNQPRKKLWRKRTGEYVGLMTGEVHPCISSIKKHVFLLSAV
ncbi:hypothetical protein EDB85DRAFT_975007 [Lactarius pseudohatsudake]|nr:hypothetical protein EDB85DRAFT_975007 [Lactarius pseudohatsudake]